MLTRGVSLITLIITIVVMAVLLTVILFTLTNNNPIDSSRVASISQTTDSVEAAVRIYLGKVRADTLGKYTTAQIILGDKTETSRYKLSNGSFKYIEENGIIKKVYKLDIQYLKDKAELKLTDEYNSLEWYADSQGKVYLVYEVLGAVPSYLKDNNEVLSTVAGFVKIQSSANPSNPDVTKIEAEITYENDLVTKTYGDTSFTNPLQNTGNGIVKYSSSATSIASVNSSGVVQINGTGTITITAEVSDTDNNVYPI